MVKVNGSFDDRGWDIAVGLPYFIIVLIEDDANLIALKYTRELMNK